MKRLSTLTALALLFVFTSHASAQLPGDVGTSACGDVQSDAQDAVSSGGPYKNNGQLVSTAAKVVDPAKTSGEITAECASCIINQFARNIPIKEQSTCGPDLCAVSGGPGWENQARPGGGVRITDDTTAQGCCQACIADETCAQWALIGGVCQLNVPPGECSDNELTPIEGSGRIRCP